MLTERNHYETTTLTPYCDLHSNHVNSDITNEKILSKDRIFCFGRTKLFGCIISLFIVLL